MATLAAGCVWVYFSLCLCLPNPMLREYLSEVERHGNSIQQLLENKNNGVEYHRFWGESTRSYTTRRLFVPFNNNELHEKMYYMKTMSFYQITNELISPKTWI